MSDSNHPAIVVGLLSSDRHDLAQLIAGWHWREWGDGGSDTPREWVSTVQQRTRDDAVPFTLLAYAGTEPVGCLSVCWDDRDAEFAAEGPWLSGMVVIGSARNLGVGRRLLAEAESWCRRFGHPTIWLHTGEAQRFYERCGWHVVRPKVGLGRDAVLAHELTVAR